MAAPPAAGEINHDDGLIKQSLNWILEAGINGFGILPSARKVAQDHFREGKSTEEIINSIIKWRTAYGIGTGFVTGVGGIPAMPIAIPAGLVASYALGANTAAAVAHVRGYEINTDQVRTLILLCLMAESAEMILKNIGISVGTKVSRNLLQQISGKVMIEINKRAGFRLITKAGEKGVINIAKMVPLAGGIVGATFDGAYVNKCGRFAEQIFTA